MSGEVGRIDDVADAFAAALTGRDRAAFADCCALDVLYEDPLTAGPLHGLGALGDHAARLWVAFPGARVERAGARLHDGRLAALPVRLEGVNSGPLGSLPATNRAVTVPGVVWAELDPPGERLWRVRAFFDLYAVGVTLGVLPTHGGMAERALLALQGFGLRSRS